MQPIANATRQFEIIQIISFLNLSSSLSITYPIFPVYKSRENIQIKNSPTVKASAPINLAKPESILIYALHKIYASPPKEIKKPARPPLTKYFNNLFIFSFINIHTFIKKKQ